MIKRDKEEERKRQNKTQTLNRKLNVQTRTKTNQLKTQQYHSLKNQNVESLMI